MTKTFNVKIITPEKMTYEGKVTSVVAPSALGYFGIWANHAPLIAKLDAGRLTLIEETGKTVVLDVKQTGFLEVLMNNVTILLRNS